MNEKTQSIWTRPWTGRSKVIAWLALLTCGIFIVVSSIAAGVAPNAVGWEYAPLALIASVFLAGLAIGGYFFIRWLCCWRNLRKFLFGVACFVTVMALALVEENLRGKHAWQKYRRQLEAEGEKFDLAALLPPEVPAESNLALMPLFKPLFEFTHGKEGIVWGDTNGITRLREISAATPAHGGTYGELILGSVEKGTFADLKQWEAFYRGNTNYPRAAASATPADTVLRALSKFGPELEQLREAAANRPYSRFPIQYGHQPSWEILLPHLSNLKALATLLDVRATSELEIGHAKEAFEDLKLAMRLSDSVRDEPILIDHLVRLAMVANNLQMVREGLIRHAWNDGQLTEIQKYLGSVDLLAEYKLAMRGERALATGGLDYLRRKGLGANPMYYLEDNDVGSESAGSFGLMPSGWFYQNMLTISRMHTEYTLAAVDEKAHRIYPAISEKGTQRVAGLSRGPYTVFARMLLPALEKAVQKSARMQTYLDATRVGCGVERYRLANGKLPETLDALAPRYISVIPNDVIDGKPLKYRPDNDRGYIIYSVGWNQTDDGGQVIWIKHKEESRADVNKGDWVWFMKG